MKWTEEKIKNEWTGITVVEVSGESCANCLTLLPILNRLMDSRTDAVLRHIEVSEEIMPLLEKWEVEAVPSILILYNDTVFAKCRGYQPEEILEIWLDAKIDELKKKMNLN